MDALRGGPGQRTNNLPTVAVVLLVEMRLSLKKAYELRKLEWAAKMAVFPVSV